MFEIAISGTKCWSIRSYILAFCVTLLFFLSIVPASQSKPVNHFSTTSEADSLISKGYIYLKGKDTSKAIDYGERALSISKSNNYSNGIKNSLLLLARVYKTQNKFSQTLDYYLQLLSEANNSNDHALKSLVYTEIGNLYFDSELYQKSLDYFLKAETCVTDPTQKIKILKDIGNAFEKAKNYPKSKEYYEKVLDYYKDDSYKKQRAGVFVTLSDICKKSNQFKDAANYEMENLALRKSLKDTSGIAVSLNNLGTIYKNLGQNKEALDYFLQSYQLKLASKDYIGMAITCINISIMYQQVEDYDESLKYLLKAYQIQKQTNREREIAHTCNLIAAVYYYKKNYLKAESYSLEAIKHAEKVKANDLVETSYKILSKIYKIQGNNDEALEYYQRFSDIKDSIALQQKIQQQELYHKYLELENKEAQIKGLRIDNELHELEFKILQLEKEKKDKDWELLKRDKDIQEITLRQQQLQQEKAINLLKLKEQQYRGESTDRELRLLKQQQLLQEREKQSLKTSAEIDRLKLDKQEAELNMQKIIQAVMIGFFIILLIIIFLEFNRFKLKQRAAQSSLTTKNLEIEQKFLRAQMNPHFIFNALNSIQSYVTLNETYEAERYLAKFSRLMRYILDNTSQAYITIEQEIKTLQLYLELEQLRFDFKFDFEIKVSNDIDQESVVIPPMLTQPFVENSIIHGIVHKKSKGHISIVFSREGEHVVCSIIDNGVGRDESLRLKKKSLGTHKSMGMQVTKDRLELLNEVHGPNFEALISDLKDLEGSSLGTKVDLKILYKEV
jgi:tetratricopeptide (TPR) repeat protein